MVQGKLPSESLIRVQERRRETESEIISKAVQQAQQRQETTWEDILQRLITWQDIWTSPLKMKYLHSDWLLSSTRFMMYGPPETTFTWIIQQDAKCLFSWEKQALTHMLSSCNYTLAHGCFTWHYVLLVIIEAMKAGCSSANAQFWLANVSWRIPLGQLTYHLNKSCSCTL